jgi:hypothetical protein
LESVFDEMREGEKKELTAAEYEQRRYDFAFHMTDWLNDLDTLVKVYRAPEHVDRKIAREFLVGFLYHVIPHLNAAGRLLLDEVSDPFTLAAAKRGSKIPR